MESNNTPNVTDASTQKISFLNRSQEISSLEDSESTISHHDARKNTTASSDVEKKKVIPTSHLTSFNDNAPSISHPHRHYHNVSPPNSVLNNSSMVTFQNPMNFNPNYMQQMQYQQNYCQPPYLHAATGIPMHHMHLTNQHNPSQSIHSPFPSFPSFPGYLPGSTVQPNPYTMNSTSFSPPMNHSFPPPPPPPPSNSVNKKRKKKPNERRIQKFRDKAARHQKALALGMALLNQMDASTSTRESVEHSRKTEDDNVSTTCLGNIKKSQTETVDEVSNVSFDIKHTSTASISNINITKKKTTSDAGKPPFNQSLPANISVTKAFPRNKIEELPAKRTESTNTAIQSTNEPILKRTHNSDFGRKSPHDDKHRNTASSSLFDNSRNSESTKKHAVTCQNEIIPLTSNKSSDKDVSSSKDTTSARPVDTAHLPSIDVQLKSRHCSPVKSDSHMSQFKRRRHENDYYSESYKAHKDERDRRRYNDYRKTTTSSRSSTEKKQQNTYSRSSSFSSKRSLKSLPSHYSSNDKNALFGHSIPRKSSGNSDGSHYGNPPEQVIVQKPISSDNSSHQSSIYKNQTSSWRQSNSNSSGWGHSSSSSGKSSQRNVRNYNPFESKKTTCYGGWLPIYYKGPPSTTIKNKSMTTKKDKASKERSRKQRLELVKMLKDRLSKSAHKENVMTNVSSFKRLETKWKIEFLEQFPPEMEIPRLFWITSFTNHFVGLKIYSMLFAAKLEIIGHITSFIIGSHAVTLKTNSKRESHHNEYALPMSILNTYKTNLFEMEFSDYRFLCGLIRVNKKNRVEDNRCGFLVNSNQIAAFCFGARGPCDKKVAYGSEQNYFYRKKRALLRTFHDLDAKLEMNRKKDEQNNYELRYDSDGDIIIEDYMFEGSYEDAQLSVEREDSATRNTLMCLLFTGFEHSLKCPFSKVYSDITQLFPCYCPDEQCKNGRYSNLDTLLQHVRSKNCDYHNILGDHINYFMEDTNEEFMEELKRSRITSAK